MALHRMEMEDQRLSPLRGLLEFGRQATLVQNLNGRLPSAD
jgi:hypothetical protein